jgi:thioredoxin-related protein
MFTASMGRLVFLPKMNKMAFLADLVTAVRSIFKHSRLYLNSERDKEMFNLNDISFCTLLKQNVSEKLRFYDYVTPFSFNMSVNKTKKWLVWLYKCLKDI